MDEQSLKKELVDFLENHRREIINSWADGVMEIPGFKASEKVLKEAHLQGMSDFFPLMVDHIKNSKRQNQFQFLKELTERGFLAGFKPCEVFKGHLVLKRVIFRLLKEKYSDKGKKLDQFRCILEGEIEEHLETIIESYHQVSTAGLQESEQKYKILTDSSLTGIFIHQDAKYVFVNDRFAEMHGYKPEELLGKGHLELIHPDQREMIKQRAYKRLKGETVPQRYEIKRLRKDGKTVWHEIMVSDPINYRGRPAIMGHEIDISESKRAEKEIRRRNEELSALNAIVVSMVQSHNQKDIMDNALEKVLEITHMDGAIIRLLDEERDELAMISRKGFQGFSPQHLEEMTRIKVDGSLSGQPVLSGEPLVIEDLSKFKSPHFTRNTMRKEGIQSIVLFPLRSKDRIHGVLNVVSRTPRRFAPQDVQLLNSIAFQIGVAIETAQLYEEAQIRRQEAETLNKINMQISSTLELKEVLRLIVENARNLLKTDMAFLAPLNEDTGVARIIASVGTRIRAFDNMDIYPGQGIGGKVLLTGEPFITHDYLNDDRISHEYDAPARAEGFVGNMSIPINFKGRTSGVLWVVTRSERHFTKQDQDIAVNLANQAAIAIENARLYQELKESAAELERSNQELQQFAYVASHDLQEPLRMVASYTQLLARRYKGKLDSDADEFIAYAVDGASRMQQLINGLLTYSRVGTKAKDLEPTDCKAVFERTLDNLQKAVEESGAKVTHDPLPTVMADRMQLGQLLQNMIGNAIKFHGEEPPRVHLSAEKIENSAIRIPQSLRGVGPSGPEAEMKKGWVFSVRDNGIGIDPEFAERIFIIFQRLHNRREYPGTGIGLAVCKKIVERHGGRIWVESKPGKGSTFYFTIPDRGA